MAGDGGYGKRGGGLWPVVAKGDGDAMGGGTDVDVCAGAGGGSGGGGVDVVRERQGTAEAGRWWKRAVRPAAPKFI